MKAGNHVSVIGSLRKAASILTPDSVGNGLRYTGGSFHYNWKTPKTPGLCYMIRMTTAQDGLAPTARFKMK